MIAGFTVEDVKHRVTGSIRGNAKETATRRAAVFERIVGGQAIEKPVTALKKFEAWGAAAEFANAKRADPLDFDLAKARRDKKQENRKETKRGITKTRR